MSTQPTRRHLAATFWSAAALSAALPFVPYGRRLLYPFAWITTWAHEMGHGLTALLMGGRFHSLELYADLGGQALTAVPDNGLAPAAVAAGGLLGPAVAGGLVIWLGARAASARWVLGLLATLLVASALLWVRSGLGFFVTLAFGLVFGALAVVLGGKAGELTRLVITQLVGIQLCLGSLASLDYMFTKEFPRGGLMIPSDTELIARQLWLPYWFWGALIALVSFAILLFAFHRAWLRGAKAPARSA